MFRDVSDAVGLDFVHDHGGTGAKYLPETMGAGGAVLDYDGDGRMDLYLVQSGDLPGSAAPKRGLGNRLYRNVDGKRFTDVTEATGTGDRGFGQGAVAGDADGDGRTDLYAVNFGRNALYRNVDGERFADVTDAAGVGDEQWGVSAAFFDAELDGDLDLYVVNYLDFSVATHKTCGHEALGIESYCHPDAYGAAPDVYYANRGDGTFEAATLAAGLRDTTGKGLGVAVLDFDDDGLPDVYVSNDSTPNFLYKNLGAGRFREEGLVLGVAYNEDGKTEAGMGIAVGDADGDRRLDLFVTNLDHEANALYQNAGAYFDYASRSAGVYEPSYPWVGFGTAFADLDSDADLDLVVANGHVIDNIELTSDAQTWRQPGSVLWNDGRGRFRAAAPEELGDFGVPRAGRGLLLLDLDDDGRLELLVTHSADRARLYRNAWPEQGAWIGFVLEGSGANTAAIGARVTVEVDGRTLVRESAAGGSYAGSHDPRLVFGLGDAQRPERVTVRWPGGATGEHAHLEAGRYWRLAPDAEPVALGAE